MKKVKHYFVLGLILITLFATIWNIFNSIFKKEFPNFLSVTSLAPVLVALYNQNNFIYIKINKLIAYIKNDTVVFKPSVKVDLENEIDVTDVYKDIRNLLTKYNLTCKQKHITKTEYGVEISKVTTPNNLNFKITASLNDNSVNQQLEVKFEYQLSSRSVKNTWNEFKKYKDFIISQHKPTRLLYSLVIDLNNSNLNPFYKITVKPLDSLKINLVDIKLNNSDINLNIQKNKIHAYSESPEILDDVVTGYIPLTNVY